MRSIIVAVFAFLAGPASACSWSGISQENVATVLAPRLEHADAVVHARVVAFRVVAQDNKEVNGAVEVQLEKQVATLAVLRSFKGDGSGRIEVAGLTTMCGYLFSVGEENVYFIRNGRVGIPNVEPASSWLLSALERTTKATPNKSLERTRDE